MEFPAGGGALAEHDIRIATGSYYSHQWKSAEFRIYETTGETGCTNVQETNNPVFTPGKIVVNARPHPPLILPERIDLMEGETYNSTGLPPAATDPANRVQVNVINYGDGDVVARPTQFWIPPGSYDFAQWPNIQITARRDSDTSDDRASLGFLLVYQGYQHSLDSFPVFVQDRNPGLEFQDVGATANFTGNLALPEGGQLTFRVRPAAPPTDGNSLEIHTSVSGGSGLQLSAPSLVYGGDDWEQWRTITLNAATDANTVNEQYAVTLWTTSAGDAAYNRGSSDYYGGSGANPTDWTIDVTVTEAPAPASAPTPGIEVQADGLEAYVKPSANLKDADRQLAITDGESVDLRLRLTQAPDADLTLSAFLGKLHSSETRLEGVTITPNPLTFTPSNWDTWQTMRVSATAGAGERGMIYLDARVPSGDPDYAPRRDVSFDIALFRSAAPVPVQTPGIEVQAPGLEAYVKPSANLKDADRQLAITDGESVDLRLRLTQAPDADLTLSAFLGRLHPSETRLEGVTITPNPLTFTPSNWNTWQTMRVSTVAGAGTRGMIYLDARVPSGDPDYAPRRDVSFDIALFRN